MRLFRKLLVLVVLCLILVAPMASAAEGPVVPAEREVSMMTRIFGQFQDLLTAVWENEGFEIDPWGRTLPEAGGESGDDPAPGTDGGWQIDPLG